MRTVTLLLSIAALALACADGGIDSGVQRNKEIQDLTVGEADAICTAAANAAKVIQSEFKDAYCKRDAAIETFFGPLDGAQACTEFYLDCLNMATRTGTVPPCQLAGTLCTATVGEVEACIDSGIEFTGLAMGELRNQSCEEFLASPVLAREVELDAEPCETVRAECPDLELEALSPFVPDAAKEL